MREVSEVTLKLSYYGVSSKLLVGSGVVSFNVRSADQIIFFEQAELV